MAKDKSEAVYNVPLYRVYWGRRRNRAPRALRYLRLFASRHFRIDPDRVRISEKVSKAIWSRGIEKPPRMISVKMVKLARDEEEYLYVLMPDEQPPELEEGE